MFYQPKLTRGQKTRNSFFRIAGVVLVVGFSSSTLAGFGSGYVYSLILLATGILAVCGLIIGFSIDKVSHQQ